MQWRLNRQYSISIGIAIAVLLALGYVAGTTMRTFLDDIHLVERTHEVLETAQSLRASIKGASSARRGYALTQDAGLAQEFYESLNAIDEHLLTLESATSKSPRQHSALAELKPLVAEYTALLHEANRSIREGAFSVEEQAAYIRKTSELDQRLRERLDVFVTEVRALLKERETQSASRSRAALTLTAIGGASAIAILIFVLLSLNAQAAARERAETGLRDANAQLRDNVDELERRSNDLAFLSKLTSLVEACRTPAEMMVVIAKSMSLHFPKSSGALFSFKNGRESLGPAAQWGAPVHTETFTPNECWAIRRGRAHESDGSAQAIACDHFGDNPPESTLCVPMTAQGEVQGVLVLENVATEWAHPVRKALANTLAETLAITLANMALRERLHTQVVTDPLTGLYNRRFMEESLQREIARATRDEKPLALIMVDIDHFKKFNDTYGHQAGDEVLQNVAAFVKTKVRGGDLACRYGGEEFAIVLPGSTLEHAVERAEVIREEVKRLRLTSRGESLPAIHLSLGVAVAPEHANTVADLIHEADAALYQAKEQGRDRTVAAELPQSA